MSKIEVNTVEPQCGTTLTLGGCGQTVALGSGASQTGFGRTGTVDWITTPKVTGDSPITGVTGKGYFLNTTAGTITLNLPAGAAGSIVSMADYAATWQTNNVTVAANGSEKIGGESNDATLSTEGQSVTLVYVDAAQGWVNTMDSTSNIRGATDFITATGGTPCTGAICGDYKTHTFTGPGSLCVSNAGQPGGSTVIDYMVVAGGGGGGRDDFGCGPTRRNGSGGGAGGFRVSNALSLPAPLTSPLASPTGITASVTSYPITVGGGGTFGVSCCSPGGLQPGAKGSNAVFSTITSTGGGGGFGHNAGPGHGPDADLSARTSGGSGGGRNYCTTNPVGPIGAGNEPPVSPSQGFPGGFLGAHPVAPYGFGGGGGGGAAAAGAVGGYLPTEGNGGSGSYISPVFGGSSGTPGPVAARYFAGGGAAGCQGGKTGGDGGGGDGGTGCGGAGTAGTVNTGGGGGGARKAAPGAGGSGVVIIRYKFQ